MKKLLLLSICLVVAVLMTVTAAADGKVEFALSSSQSNLYRGDTVTLTASVSSSEAATQYGLSLEYDENVFELVEGNCSAEGALVNSFDNGFAFMFQNPNAYSGSVGSITLKVKDTAPFGSYTISGVSAVKNGNEDVSSNGATATVVVECNHTYGEWENFDGVHKQTCSICQDVKTAEHTWDEGVTVKEATCVEEGDIQYTCTACKATKNETVKTLDHVFGEWESVDENNHKRICKGCQKEETAAHTFSDVLTEGETTHWNACVCGVKKNETAHSFDVAKWSSDEENHWHSCECGAKSENAAHGWDEGKVTKQPTLQSEGEKVYTCKVCGTQKNEHLPVAKPVPGSNPQTGSHNMIIAIVLGLMSACGVTVCTFSKKKEER